MDNWVVPPADQSSDDADRIVEERVQKKMAAFLTWFEQIIKYIGVALEEYEYNEANKQGDIDAED